jgi:hypothetical protein
MNWGLESAPIGRVAVMNETPNQSRHRIGLAAFLAAFIVVALWLGWAGSVTRILDQVRAKRAVRRMGLPRSGNPSTPAWHALR